MASNSGQGSISFSTNAPSGGPFVPGSADNGLSVDPSTGHIVLGDDGSGNLADLLSDRFIQSQGFNISILEQSIGGADKTLFRTLAPTAQIAIATPQITEGLPVLIHSDNDKIIYRSAAPFNFIFAETTTNNATPTTIYIDTISSGLSAASFQVSFACILNGGSTKAAFTAHYSAAGPTGATRFTLLSSQVDPALAGVTVTVDVVAGQTHMQVQGIAATPLIWSVYGFYAGVSTTGP